MTVDNETALGFAFCLFFREKLRSVAISAEADISHQSLTVQPLTSSSPPGGSHPEHDYSSGPLLPAVSGGEPPQSAETHRGRDQDRGGEPGAPSGDRRVPGPQEACRSVRAGWSGEQTLFVVGFFLGLFYLSLLWLKTDIAELYVFIM